ncbi:hypothetical protein FGO68_gene12011 [Halteria grandinella]|uniref:TLC domain-containing protein n=1 Tax=Halteria grandinella TaxID=5974 RepID=A0A8J8T0M3_HALGN|nr:hypothetical protein FGO68_gene12011 [Halteria grandinella]
MIVTTLFFLAMENGISKALTHKFEGICREQNDMEARKVRSQKAVKNIYKGFYFLGTTTFAYMLLKDSYIMPPLLGGNDSFYEHFTHYPYWEHPKYYTEFYMTCLGYNVAGLLQELFFEDRGRSDYLEMLIHHLITVYLVFFGYATNIFMGAPVILVHNASDTLISFVRVINESKYYGKGIFIFIPSLIVWIYMRCMTFPQLLYTVIFYTNHVYMPPLLMPLFRLCLCCLQCLHFYWTFLLFKIIYNFAFKGVADDIIDKNKVSNEKVKET